MSDPEPNDADWQHQVAELWARFDTLDATAFLAEMQALSDRRPTDDAEAAFELASAHDSIGREAEAEPLYRRALDLGLQPPLRRRATIQLASTLRNLGRAAESVALLEAEQRQPSDELDNALLAFLILALADLGEDRRAIKVALLGLSSGLPRYTRSLAHYIEALPPS